MLSSISTMPASESSGTTLVQVELRSPSHQHSLRPCPSSRHAPSLRPCPSLASRPLSVPAPPSCHVPLSPSLPLLASRHSSSGAQGSLMSLDGTFSRLVYAPNDGSFDSPSLSEATQTSAQYYVSDRFKVIVWVNKPLLNGF